MNIIWSAYVRQCSNRFIRSMTFSNTKRTEVNSPKRKFNVKISNLLYYSSLDSSELHLRMKKSNIQWQNIFFRSNRSAYEKYKILLAVVIQFVFIFFLFHSQMVKNDSQDFFCFVKLVWFRKRIIVEKYKIYPIGHTNVEYRKQSYNKERKSSKMVSWTFTKKKIDKKQNKICRFFFVYYLNGISYQKPNLSSVHVILNTLSTRPNHEFEHTSTHFTFKALIFGTFAFHYAGFIICSCVYVCLYVCGVCVFV